MSKKVTTSIFTLFLIFTLVFIFYHSFGTIKKQYKTEMVHYSKANEIIHSDGFVIRDETLINSNEKGIMVYGVSNGSKVANGSTIVEYYDSSSDVALKKHIDLLQKKISTLEDINKQNQIYAPDLNAIASQMKNVLYDIMYDVEKNNFNNIDNKKEKILVLFCQNQLATKRESDYTAIINEYKSQLSKLKQQYKHSSKTIKSNLAGYFVNSADGFENSLDYNDIDELTVDHLNNIEKTEIPSNCIGKIIKGPKWYIATTVDINQSRIFTTGKSFKMFLPLSTADELTCTVEKVNKDFTTKKAVVVFSFTNMNEELSLIRHQPLQIVVKEYKGLRVNSKAVRVLNGVKGVYVKLGNITRFREINVLYSTRDYVIAELSNSNNSLKIYDDVFIEGKKLNE